MSQTEKPRILIVEDDRALAEEYTVSLDQLGYCKIVERTEEVYFEVANFAPDIILLDIVLEEDRVHLPREAGMMILKKIKEYRLPYRDTPVIVVTGRIEPEVENHCRNLGVVDFFRKPVSIKKIRKAVTTALQDRCLQSECVKIFISSNMDELQAERWTAFQAIEELGSRFRPELAENWKARPQPAREIWRQAVSECNIFVLLIGEKYGIPSSETGISATEDEYNTARKLDKSILVFKMDSANRDARLISFLTRLLSPSTGHLVKSFNTNQQLREEVQLAIKQLANFDS